MMRINKKKDMKYEDLKVNDVYDFAYNEEYKSKHQGWEMDHCFDYQLVVRERYDGMLILEDTYWGSCSESHRFTLEEALRVGSLKFKCNLDEVTKCSQHDYKYYKEEDIFDLSTQHHCYPHYALRKGAQRNKDVMLNYVKRMIEEKKRELEYKIHSLNYDIKRLEEQQESILNGEDINKMTLWG